MILLKIKDWDKKKLNWTAEILNTTWIFFNRMCFLLLENSKLVFFTLLNNIDINPRILKDHERYTLWFGHSTIVVGVCMPQDKTGRCANILQLLSSSTVLTTWNQLVVLNYWYTNCVVQKRWIPDPIIRCVYIRNLVKFW